MIQMTLGILWQEKKVGKCWKSYIVSLSLYVNFIQIVDEKKLRSIGVSNYEIFHLEELLGHAKVLPAVNQCEYHPHYYTKDLVKYCESKDIHFQVTRQP